MRCILAIALTLSLTSGAAAVAQSNNPNRGSQNDNRNERNPQSRNEQEHNDRGGNQDQRSDSSDRAYSPRWSRGDRLPEQYRQKQYVVNDWKQQGLKQPPRGQHWVRNDNHDFFLVTITTGIIAEPLFHDDRDQRWKQSYSRPYTYNDDIYYQECRNSPDPAGVLVGALIGGLLGTASRSGDGRAGATVAGVVVGGAVGAALTNNLDCEDRSYAYKTYFDGFNTGRPNATYRWRNPRNNHRGEFRVGKYYNDRSGFRCAEYRQVIHAQGKPQEARGNACRQPDGTWAIVN